MPYNLSTTISRINLIPNQTNAKLISEFHRFMQSKNCSERHQNNNLQVLIGFGRYLGAHISEPENEREDNEPVDEPSIEQCIVFLVSLNSI